MEVFLQIQKRHCTQKHKAYLTPVITNQIAMVVIVRVYRLSMDSIAGSQMTRFLQDQLLYHTDIGDITHPKKEL